MRKKYLLPQQKIVEIDECDVLCGSEDVQPKSMSVELNDYSTYKDTPRSPSNPVNWDGVGTGSDF